MDDYQQNYSNRPSQTPPSYTGNSDRFAIASLVCGILALALLCTGIFSIPFGALGILFAVLSHRKQLPFTRIGKMGIIFSSIGLIFGIIFTAYVCITIVIPMFTDPAFREELNTFYQNTYGISLDSLLSNY